MGSIQHIASFSGGKDSLATLLLGMEMFPDGVVPVFADTGNEHESVYEYIEYIECRLSVKIHTVKADFSDRFASRREYILTKWPEKGVPLSKCEQAASLMYSTGNPFLDLCMLKGRFPSRKAQFCTQELKTIPLTEFALSFIDTYGCMVWSWQGIRRDESGNRRNAKVMEDLSGGIWAFRPIVCWSAQNVVDFIKSRGVRLNPHYMLGFKRFGCTPCINMDKASIANIDVRFPEVVERIKLWESIVGAVSKRGASSFFPAPDRDVHLIGDGRIEQRIRWAKTLRGGVEYDTRYDEPAPLCAASWGLCES